MTHDLTDAFGRAFSFCVSLRSIPQQEQKAKERENALRLAASNGDGDVEAMPLVGGTASDELKSRTSPGGRRS